MRNLTAVLLIFGTLVVQVSVVNRLLGSFAPDLVLVVVLTLAALRGPLAGAVLGFFGGFAYDLLPPVHHALGHYALVLCALGYLAGRVGGQLPGLTVAVCVVLAPGLSAAVGALLGTPGVTWEVLRAAWPRAALCNVLAVLVVMWAMRAWRRRRRRGGRPDLVTSWRRGMA